MGKGASRAVPTIYPVAGIMVGTPSGAHSRDPLALPTLRFLLCLIFIVPVLRFSGVREAPQQPQQLRGIVLFRLRGFGEGYHVRHGLVPYSTSPRRISVLARDCRVSATSVLRWIRSPPQFSQIWLGVVLQVVLNGLDRDGPVADCLVSSLAWRSISGEMVRGRALARGWSCRSNPSTLTFHL